MKQFFSKIFDTSDFPARWNCGNWDSFHGWLHIVSDLLIWAAYFMIPFALVYYWWKKRSEMEFPKLFWLFGAFIFSCGITHFIEAVIFYHPIYRISGVMKFATALVSWMTVIAIIRITPMALALPGRARLSDRLAESNRELEEYTGRVSHDLRNPLGSAIMWGNLALESTDKGDTAAARNRINSLVEALVQMEKSVRQLQVLALAKNSRKRHDTVSLDTIIETVRKALSQKISETATEIIAEELPTVNGDRTLLIHLFTNLIENAIKYAGELSPEIRITSELRPGNHIIRITDNGRGIAGDDLDRIFESYYRPSNVGDIPGSGVGLSLCRSIMGGHGGSINVTSRLGKGTTFELRFPR